MTGGGSKTGGLVLSAAADVVSLVSGTMTSPKSPSPTT